MVLGLLLASAEGGGCSAQPASERPSDRDVNFLALLEKIAVYSPDPCGGSTGEQDWDTGGVESSIFSEAADAVAQGLNASVTTSNSPRERAAGALTALESMSAKTNAAWPEENRFHFEVLDFSPALIVKASIRTQAAFFLFGVMSDPDRNPDQLWRQIWANSNSATENALQKSLEIYPLDRGPAGKIRFLVHFGYSGCAGSLGVAYEGYEWNEQDESATEILEQKGSFGLESLKLFPQIGRLRTAGPLITLPYCWFSAIDWWDNPSLCAVDTYDLSGKEVKFRSRTYNRPDLVPVAKAIEYAEAHDFPAVRGYCSSDDVARRLVEEISYSVGAEKLEVTRTGAGKERVALGDEAGYYFDVEKRIAGWVVTGFGTD
jgi:hypothetical protein